MAQEVLLEIVDEVNSLIEELLVLATVHQDCFCTKHFRHLGEDACTALCHEPIRELAHQWISGDAAESVRSAALQAHAELAHRNLLSLIFLGLGIEIAEDFHAFLNLIAFYLLGNEQLDAVFVVIAQHRHEIVWLVVLAAQ